MDTGAIFANPIAGRGKARQFVSAIEEALKRNGYRALVFLKRVDALKDEELAGLSKAKAVVSIGGDGTLRGVVDRLVGVCRPLPPFLVVPMGTANLMAIH